MLQNLAKMNFKSKAIKLPTDWQQPSGEQGKQYADAFKPAEKSVPPDPARIFMPASVNKYHVDTQKSVGEKTEKYIDGICSAICSAWSSWHSTATFTGVIINAVTGVMPPGGLIGPPLMPLS
ncbi:MAG: hypothetical protein FJ088_14065, partial [Deltaproteobacteria bacterium]|nr:hypothetical protein [Deltaproteobacteria bacterium]